MEVKPHILRRVYKDPMTREGDWDYLYQVQPGATGDTTGLPIVGVRSKSMKDSIRIYQNKTLIHDWIFSADANILGIPARTRREGQRRQHLGPWQRRRAHRRWSEGPREFMNSFSRSL